MGEAFASPFLCNPDRVVEINYPWPGREGVNAFKTAGHEFAVYRNGVKVPFELKPAILASVIDVRLVSCLILILKEKDA